MAKVLATLVIAKVEQLWNKAYIFSKIKNVRSERDVVVVQEIPSSNRSKPIVVLT